MIELNIPKDIRKIDNRFIGPLNKRQTVSVVIALPLIFGVRIGLSKFVGGDLPTLVAAILGVPILACGFFPYQGLPLEKYVKDVLWRKVKGTSKRTYHVSNWWKALDRITNDEGELLSDEEIEKRKIQERKQRELSFKRSKKKWKPKTQKVDFDCYL